MRTNSTGLRLNYSSSWANKIMPGRNYVDNFVHSKFSLNNYLKGIFQNEYLLSLLINSYYRIYFINNNRVLLNVYIYVHKYSFLSKAIENRNRGYSLLQKRISHYINYNLFGQLLQKTRLIMLTDLSKILPKKYFFINFIVLKKRYFGASIASLYITNKLLNKFKLTKVVEDLNEDLIHYKQKSGVIVHCSGRFDRKERASSAIFSKGKISLTTMKNKITYHHSEVVLKYGVCGVKVWVLE